MLAFAYYILKVIVCSAILFGYYWFFLRNKVFHAYNRFYLLAVVTLSLTLPLIRFQLFPAKEQPKTTVIKMLQVVSAGDDYVNDVFIPAAKPAAQQISFAQILPFLYALVSVILLIMLIQMLVKIFMMLRCYQSSDNEGIHFVNTVEEKGTPFSFFRYIFWNNAIDIQTPSGNRIFRHEVAHIQEKHSIDKMFINIVLTVFWSNPVFWLIRRELNMIHEFIADKRAVEDGDTAAFAAMILEAAYPHHRMQITNNFFYSPIKRRLMMLTKNQRPAVNYISRLLVLPLALMVFAAFTIKAHSSEKNKKDNTSLAADNKTEKQLTVVIDAGHGGKDIGAMNQTGLGYKEKDLSLDLVKKIAALNDNKNIKLIMLRETDIYQSAKEKAILAATYNPDVFISIHLDGGPKPSWDVATGMSVFIAKNEAPNVHQSKILASAVLNSFRNNYALAVPGTIMQRAHGIWVLQANTFASVLIEAGYITNKKDALYLTSEEGQTAFAKNVLNAINDFADADKIAIPASELSDSLGMYKGQKVTGIRMTNKNDKVQLILANGKTEWVTVEECKKLHIKLPPPPPAPPVLPAAPNMVAPPAPPAAPAAPGTPPPPQAPPSPSFKDEIRNALNSENVNASQVVFTGETNNIFKTYTRQVTLVNQPTILPLGQRNILALRNGIAIDSKNIKLDKGDEIVVLKPAEAVAKYGAKASDGAIEIATQRTAGYDPVFRVANFTKSRLPVVQFINATKVSVTDGYDFIEATVYFSAKGFEKVLIAKLTTANLTDLKNMLAECVSGTNVTFDNVRVKNAEGMRVIEGLTYSLY